MRLGWFPKTVAIKPRQKVVQMTNQAQAGHCKAAASYWKTARNYYPTEHPERRRLTPTSESILARCYADLSAASDDVVEQIDLLKIALRWDHHDAHVQSIASAMAVDAHTLGEKHLQAGKLDAAYTQWRLALVANPNQAMLRRRIEALEINVITWRAPLMELSRPISLFLLGCLVALTATATSLDRRGWSTGKPAAAMDSVLGMPAEPIALNLPQHFLSSRTSLRSLSTSLPVAHTVKLSRQSCQRSNKKSKEKPR